MTCKCVYIGDDAPDLITINYNNSQGYVINKLYTTCGEISHVYDNPDFPFKESYTSEETLKFTTVNTFYAGVDIEGIGYRTFNNSLTFRACPKVVNWEAANVE